VEFLFQLTPSESGVYKATLKAGEKLKTHFYGNFKKRKLRLEL